MIADPYNIIAEVEVPDLDALGELATKNIEHARLVTRFRVKLERLLRPLSIQ